MLSGAIQSILVTIICVGGSFSHAANCDSTSKGFIPLTELTGTYKGQPGGLYPGGINQPPIWHHNNGISLAQSFVPLNTSGLPDTVNGSWVLLSVGMSNTTQEFSRFVLDMQGDTTRHPQLRIVDGAQGGQTAAKIVYDTAAFWTVINNRLTTQGLSSKQVRAVWLKEANAGPTNPFPGHAISLRDNLRDVVRLLKVKYPNILQVFVSSRIYAGYASTTLNPEPFSYEAGFSYRWLIESQLTGNDSLNYLSDSGAVKAPWLAWGPYLWADGVIPRQIDGLTWLCSDLVSDGTHPSDSGRVKVASMLEEFFKTSPYTGAWFLKDFITPCCLAATGNVDCDLGDVADISDLTALIDNLFISLSPLCCPNEANTDGTGAVDISDLTALIDHLFISLASTTDCP
ncbi:MAG: hypothetical protein SGI97_01740 [candidate division Zixibacteria bacterium]|nr:hypothetical protein [candidate division Zixibacteria bacterium]